MIKRNRIPRWDRIPVFRTGARAGNIEILDYCKMRNQSQSIVDTLIAQAKRNPFLDVSKMS